MMIMMMMIVMLMIVSGDSGYEFNIRVNLVNI